AIRKELLKKQPGLVTVWDSLSMSYANLASHYLMSKNVPQAIDSLEKAADASEMAVKLQPGVVHHVTQLAQVLNKLGEQLVAGKQLEPALERYDRAVAVLAAWEKKGVETLPPSMALQILDAHSGKAEVLSELKRYKEAIRHHNRALAVAPNNKRNRLLYQRALTLA